MSLSHYYLPTQVSLDKAQVHTFQMEAKSLPLRQKTKQAKKPVHNRIRTGGRMSHLLAAACCLSKMLARDSKETQRGPEYLPTRSPAPLVNCKDNLPPLSLSFRRSSPRINTLLGGSGHAPYPRRLAPALPANHPPHLRIRFVSNIPVSNHLRGLPLIGDLRKAGADVFSMPFSTSSQVT